jgi:hypothetical protein
MEKDQTLCFDYASILSLLSFSSIIAEEKKRREEEKEEEKRRGKGREEIKEKIFNYLLLCY